MACARKWRLETSIDSVRLYHYHYQLILNSIIFQECMFGWSVWSHFGVLCPAVLSRAQSCHRREKHCDNFIGQTFVPFAWGLYRYIKCRVWCGYSPWFVDTEMANPAIGRTENIDIRWVVVIWIRMNEMMFLMRSVCVSWHRALCSRVWESIEIPELRHNPRISPPLSILLVHTTPTPIHAPYGHHFLELFQNSIRSQSASP